MQSVSPSPENLGTQGPGPPLTPRKNQCPKLAPLPDLGFAFQSTHLCTLKSVWLSRPWFSRDVLSCHPRSVQPRRSTLTTKCYKFRPSQWGVTKVKRPVPSKKIDCEHYFSCKRNEYSSVWCNRLTWDNRQRCRRSTTHKLQDNSGLWWRNTVRSAEQSRNGQSVNINLNTPSVETQKMVCVALGCSNLIRVLYFAINQWIASNVSKICENTQSC